MNWVITENNKRINTFNIPTISIDEINESELDIYSNYPVIIDEAIEKLVAENAEDIWGSTGQPCALQNSRHCKRKCYIQSKTL